MSNRTHGLWHVHQIQFKDKEGNPFAAIMSEDSKYIGQVSLHTDEGQGNLDLIVTAPDLLSVCQEAVAWLSTPGHNTDLFSGQVLLRLISNAVTKALPSRDQDA